MSLRRSTFFAKSFFIVGLLALPSLAHAFLGMNVGANAQTPLPWWTKQNGSISGRTTLTVNGAKSDSSNYIYLVGSTDGKFDSSNTQTGAHDFLVIKYDSTGTKQWARQMGVAGMDTTGYGVAVDTSFNVFVAGGTYGGLDGNTVTGSMDFFVTKYNSAGTKQWTKQMGVSTKSTSASGVATDISGNCYVTGATNGNLDGNTINGTQDAFLTKYDSSGNKQWTKLTGVASKQTTPQGVVTDSNGNSYIGGLTYGGLDGNTLTGTSDFFLTKYDASGTKQWTRQLGVAGKATIGTSVALDGSGNVYISGTTSGGLDGNTLTGFQDTFVTKYNPSGTKQWTKLIGGTFAFSLGTSITIDSAGNILMAGTVFMSGFDGNTLTGSQDFFVTQFNSAGTKQWSRELGVASLVTNGTAVAADSSNNPFVIGSTTGGLDGNTLTGNTDLFITKYNSSGTKQSTWQIGLTTRLAWTEGYALAKDASGNIIMAGTADGNIDGVNVTGQRDSLVIKYDSNGVRQWTKLLGVTGHNTNAMSVATDSSSNIFVAGYADGGVDGNTLSGAVDFFLTKYDSSGNKLWTKQMGVSGKLTYAFAVTTDSAGNVYVTGQTTGNLDGNTLTGFFDMFLVKYNTSGTKQWSRLLGAASAGVAPSGITRDSSDNILITGTTSKGLDGNTLTGTTDFYVTKYNSSGTKQWTKELGVASSDATSTGIAVDSSDNFFVTGYVTGGLDGNTLTGTEDLFLTKYNSSGTKQWTKQMGAAGKDTDMFGIAIDSLGNVYLGGDSTGAVDKNQLTGVKDLVVVKYDNGGTLRWTRQYGATSALAGISGICVDNLGGLYVAGSTDHGLDGNTQIGIGTTDYFLIRYGGN